MDVQEPDIFRNWIFISWAFKNPAVSGLFAVLSDDYRDFLFTTTGAYFSTGGTYSLGGAAPSPKKYCSICLTITS